MTTLQKWAKTIPLLMLAMACQCATASDVVLVVSLKSEVSTLTTEQVVDIFLGKTSTFPNGVRVIPIDQQEGTNEREMFYHEFIGKTAAQVRTYWSKIVFTGKGYPPIEVAPSDRVKRVVRDNPNYIGYIDRRDVDASVKVISVPHQ
jgi:ABC-type phosphate transport system substrate-binding protein